ncbi:MAG: hypothetical protein V3U29_01910, partial [Phycisphaeraceae bacterium]
MRSKKLWFAVALTAWLLYVWAGVPTHSVRQKPEKIRFKDVLYRLLLKEPRIRQAKRPRMQWPWYESGSRRSARAGQPGTERDAGADHARQVRRAVEIQLIADLSDDAPDDSGELLLRLSADDSISNAHNDRGFAFKPTIWPLPPWAPEPKYELLPFGWVDSEDSSASESESKEWVRAKAEDDDLDQPSDSEPPTDDELGIEPGDDVAPVAPAVSASVGSIARAERTATRVGQSAAETIPSSIQQVTPPALADLSAKQATTDGRDRSAAASEKTKAPAQVEVARGEPNDHVGAAVESTVIDRAKRVVSLSAIPVADTGSVEDQTTKPEQQVANSRRATDRGVAAVSLQSTQVAHAGGMATAPTVVQPQVESIRTQPTTTPSQATIVQPSKRASRPAAAGDIGSSPLVVLIDDSEKLGSDRLARISDAVTQINLAASRVGADVRLTVTTDRSAQHNILLLESDSQDLNGKLGLAESAYVSGRSGETR